MTSGTNAPADSHTDLGSRDLLQHLWLVCQLLLVLKVIHVFDIEGRRQLFPVMCLATFGFVIHHRLPELYRPRFFLLLSLASFVLVLGWQNTASVVAIGLVLFGTCHLPIPLLGRSLLLLGMAGILVYLRMVQPLPFWPIVGSIFMFRLAIYLREMERVRKPVPFAQRLSYFFLLPNVCFPFFPLIDYQSFVSTYRNEEDVRIAQRGIAWIVRGIVHLVLYRFVKYHVLPPPEDILNVWEATVFLAANYALYLQVSGTFHLITGVLHLFGFNLPRTHDWYFLAHSFSDIWRRINIYWKNFLTQHFFFPAFFACRAAGNQFAIVAAVAVVFVCTWLLHSYQVFWLLGNFPIRRYEAGLWLIAGLVVAVNSLVDYHNAQRVRTRPGRGDILQALQRSVQIVGVFLGVSIFWGSWAHRALVPGLTLASRHTSGFMAGYEYVLAAILSVIAALTIAQLLRDRWRFPGWTADLAFERSPAPAVTLLLALLILSNPSFQQLFHTDTARVLTTLTVDYPTTLDLARSVPGYYEELAAANLQVDAFFATETPKPRKGELLYSDITRPRNDLMELELIPRWKGTLAGAPMSINRWGMRDGVVMPQKPANTTRVAVMGSSVVMGYGVRDEEVFTELVEAKLNAMVRPPGQRFELLNFAVGRYYALHIAAALREKVFEFHPDVVFYVAHQGELYGPLSQLAKFRFERYPMPYASLDAIMRNAGITDDTAWGSIQTMLQPHAREITLSIYRGIVGDCRERGIRPVWIYLPMPGIVEVSANTSEMLKLAEQAGFEVLDLSHWSDGRRPEEVKFGATDHHANALGHRIIAEQLFQLLQRRPELLQPGTR